MVMTIIITWRRRNSLHIIYDAFLRISPTRRSILTYPITNYYLPSGWYKAPYSHRGKLISSLAFVGRRDKWRRSIIRTHPVIWIILVDFPSAVQSDPPTRRREIDELHAHKHMTSLKARVRTIYAPPTIEISVRNAHIIWSHFSLNNSVGQFMNFRRKREEEETNDGRARKQ